MSLEGRTTILIVAVFPSFPFLFVNAGSTGEGEVFLMLMETI